MLHIKNRHEKLRSLIPETKLGWLNGLLKPQSSEVFKRSPVKGKKKAAKKIGKLGEKGAGQRSFKMQESTKGNSFVTSLIQSPVRPSFACSPTKSVNQKINDWNIKAFEKNSPTFGNSKFNLLPNKNLNQIRNNFLNSQRFVFPKSPNPDPSYLRKFM